MENTINKIILKITEKEKENIEKEVEKSLNNNIVKFKITENNKVIILNKNALNVFKKNGVNIEKVYYSYNKNQSLYNALEKIVLENKNIFSIINQ